jgi:hypothetical protein
MPPRARRLAYHVIYAGILLLLPGCVVFTCSF